MRILVVGSGGREHALTAALAASPRSPELLCAPGNPGTAEHAENVAVAADDLDGLVALAQRRAADLVIVGPEQPLVLGLVDRLDDAGIAAVGPRRALARLEGSKAHANDVMARYGVPTAASRTFGLGSVHEARAYVAAQPLPVVLKADGLAGGKGVVIAETREAAHRALGDMLEAGAFGAAGATVVIEDFLRGEEASVFVLSDGVTHALLPAAQDHKRLLDGDRGPNTGGMGAYAPAPVVTDAVRARVEAEIVRPLLDGLRAEGTPYRGILYVGLMIDADGAPSVVEFNVRFGDPEAQVLLPLLQTDAVELFEALAHERLSEVEVRVRPRRRGVRGAGERRLPGRRGDGPAHRRRRPAGRRARVPGRRLARREPQPGHLRRARARRDRPGRHPRAGAGGGLRRRRRRGVPGPAAPARHRGEGALRIVTGWRPVRRAAWGLWLLAVGACAGPARVETRLPPGAVVVAAVGDGRALAADGRGGVYLVDGDDATVQRVARLGDAAPGVWAAGERFGGRGFATRDGGGLLSPRGLDASGLLLLVADEARGEVARFTTRGERAAPLVIPDLDPAAGVAERRDATAPRGRPIAVASRAGTIWVADAGRRHILRFADDRLAGVLGGPADGAAALERPTALALGRDGTLYVADGRRIQTFGPLGRPGARARARLRRRERVGLGRRRPPGRRRSRRRTRRAAGGPPRRRPRRRPARHDGARPGRAAARRPGPRRRARRAHAPRA